MLINPSQKNPNWNIARPVRTAAFPEFTSIGTGFPFPIKERTNLGFIWHCNDTVQEQQQSSPPPTSALLRLRLKWASPSWPLSGVWFHLVCWWTAFGPPALRVRLDGGASNSVALAQGTKWHFNNSSVCPVFPMRPAHCWTKKWAQENKANSVNIKEIEYRSKLVFSCLNYSN